MPTENEEVTEDSLPPNVAILPRSVEATALDENPSMLSTPEVLLKWGALKGIAQIRNQIHLSVSTVTTWRKNFFDIPKNAIGKAFVNEATRLLRLYNNRTCWSPLALHMFCLFFPLMLQKPAKRSKPKDHTRHLLKRLAYWKEGHLHLLMSESIEIQKRLVSGTNSSSESRLKAFSRLMLEGKVKQALKLVDSSNDITGVHTMTADVKQKLKEKHPEEGELHADALSAEDIGQCEDVIFEEIDGEMVQQVVKGRCRDMETGFMLKISWPILKRSCRGNCDTR